MFGPEHAADTVPFSDERIPRELRLSMIKYREEDLSCTAKLKQPDVACDSESAKSDCMECNLSVRPSSRHPASQAHAQPTAQTLPKPVTRTGALGEHRTVTQNVLL